MTNAPIAEIAARAGVSQEAAAVAALRAQLDADPEARTEIEAGLAELDAGRGMNLEAYERERDAFMAQPPPARPSAPPSQTRSAPL